MMKTILLYFLIAIGILVFSVLTFNSFISLSSYLVRFKTEIIFYDTHSTGHLKKLSIYCLASLITLVFLILNLYINKPKKVQQWKSFLIILFFGFSSWIFYIFKVRLSASNTPKFFDAVNQKSYNINSLVFENYLLYGFILGGILSLIFSKMTLKEVFSKF